MAKFSLSILLVLMIGVAVLSQPIDTDDDSHELDSNVKDLHKTVLGGLKLQQPVGLVKSQESANCRRRQTTATTAAAAAAVAPAVAGPVAPAGPAGPGR